MYKATGQGLAGAGDGIVFENQHGGLTYTAEGYWHNDDKRDLQDDITKKVIESIVPSPYNENES